METKYWVNAKTRMCNVTQNCIPDEKGFVEVTCDAMELFRAETRAAIAAGWKPHGRKSYAKFVSERNAQ